MQEYYTDLSANADSLVAYLQERLDFLRKVFATTSEHGNTGRASAD